MRMSQRRQQICRFIDKFRKRKGYSPSIRQVCRGVGIKSTSNVWYHFQRMERDGLLKRDQGVSRSVIVSAKVRLSLERAPRDVADRQSLKDNAK